MLVLVAAQCNKTTSQPSPSAEEGPPPPPVATASPPQSTGLQFVAEKVELTIGDGQLEVVGHYTFRPSGQRAWRGRIGYPIFVTAEQPAPAQVLLAGDKLPVRCREQSRCAAVIALELQLGESRTISLHYQQKLAGRRATYLLMSALRWQRPLDRATLVVRVPAAWPGVSLSYPPDQEQVDGDWRVLRLTRRDFAPDQDLVVTWEKPD